MDAFFVSCELLRRPELRGKPVVVGGAGARGVVAAASYEARAYGVFSAMPATRARQLCPHATFLDGDHRHYAEVSVRVMQLFRDVTPLVEPLSLDEAFLDVAGAVRLFGEPPAIAHALRDRVLEQEGLTCSVGVAPSKFLAKLASEAAKPKASPQGPVFGPGVVVIPPGGELAFLHPLPVRALWGVGPATQKVFDRLGIRTVGDIAAFDERALVAALGQANGRHLFRLANAIDPRGVDPDLQAKSISHEETFARDHTSLATLRVEAVRMADAVATRLRALGRAGRTVTIKVRFHDFRTITRSTTLPGGVDTGTDVARAAKALLDQIDPSAGVRLLGVAVSGLDDHGAVQLSFGEDGRWAGATAAVDAIRDRFGDAAIVPAAIAGRAPKRRGEQQWGPDAS
ncbi:MAG: DNA polymerase IV [Acidimicrobiia bacterium]|nr:DNA polymerase IV [Acidimicrobiia bacterium]